jgi:hypothetical protein
VVSPSAVAQEKPASVKSSSPPTKKSTSAERQSPTADLGETAQGVAPENSARPPANDDFANAISITANPFTDTKDSSGATTETTDPSPSCVSGSATKGRSNSIWFQFRPAMNGSASPQHYGQQFQHGSFDLD